MGAFLILLLGGVVVLGWVASEFQDRRWLRLVLGGSALVVVGTVAFLAATLFSHFNSNAWYGAASGELIDATVRGVEQKRTVEVVAELKRLRERFQPTYEKRARYDRLVEEYVRRLDAGKELE